MSEQISLLIFVNDFLRRNLGYDLNVRIEPNGYQNNHNWAIHNKSKGFYSSCIAVGSTVSGCIKACSNKDSTVYKVSNFFEKVFYSLSNCIQYFLFDRKDDVLEYDNLNNPIAANAGKVATFTEKYIEPIAKPATVFLEPNLQEAANDTLSFFDVLYWKLRFVMDKINLTNLKLIPAYIKDIINPNVDTKEKENATKNIVDFSMSFLASIGSACIGIFTPIKIFLNLIDKENKIINSLGACGKSVINLLYFFKFTLEWFWKGIIKKDKSCHALFGLGATSNALNLALPAIELLPKEENGFLDKFSRLWKSLASNLSLLFWGIRRNKLGNEWIENSQLKN